MRWSIPAAEARGIARAAFEACRRSRSSDRPRTVATVQRALDRYVRECSDAGAIWDLRIEGGATGVPIRLFDLSAVRAMGPTFPGGVGVIETNGVDGSWSAFVGVHEFLTGKMVQLFCPRLLARRPPSIQQYIDDSIARSSAGRV